VYYKLASPNRKALRRRNALLSHAVASDLDRVSVHAVHARTQLQLARRRWRELREKEEAKEWEDLSFQTEDPETKRIVWAKWKQMSPSKRWPLRSVTQRKADPIPSTIKESLNNMAAFYSVVMSDAPIPKWESRIPWVRPRNTRHYTADGLLPCTLDMPISLQEVEDACRSDCVRFFLAAVTSIGVCFLLVPRSATSCLETSQCNSNLQGLGIPI